MLELRRHVYRTTPGIDGPLLSAAIPSLWATCDTNLGGVLQDEGVALGGMEAEGRVGTGNRMRFRVDAGGIFAARLEGGWHRAQRRSGCSSSSGAWGGNYHVARGRVARGGAGRSHPNVSRARTYRRAGAVATRVREAAGARPTARAKSASSRQLAPRTSG